jgi:hypothetical protein
MPNLPVVAVVAALAGILLSIGPPAAAARPPCNNFSLVCQCLTPPPPPPPTVASSRPAVGPGPCRNVCKRHYRCP